MAVHPFGKAPSSNTGTPARGGGGTPRPNRTGNDLFVDMVFHSSTDTPFSDAYTNKIKDPQTPIAERVTLGMMFPLLIPITVILDVIFYPWIKLGQLIDWVKDKLS